MLEDEATIARERLVGAVPRQRDRHLLARQLADAVGRQRARVGEGLVETVGDPVDQREIGGGDGAGTVIGGKAFGDLPRVCGLVQRRLVEADGAGLYRLGARLDRKSTRLNYSP